MPTLNIPQGTINRLRTSLIIPGFPGLNLTAPYFGKAGLRIAFEGDSTVYLDTQTGAVTSPEPYVKVTMTANLTMPLLANAYKTQLETSSLLGDLTVRTPSAALSAYNFSNCAIQRAPSELDLSGASADFNVVIGGIYIINAALWNA